MKKKIIVVVSQDVDIAGYIRHILREEGFDTIACGTITNMIEKLDELPKKERSFAALIIDPVLLKRMSDNLKKQLSECVPKVPLLPLHKNIEAQTKETFKEICQNRAQLAKKEKLESISS